MTRINSSANRPRPSTPSETPLASTRKVLLDKPAASTNVQSKHQQNIFEKALSRPLVHLFVPESPGQRERALAVVRQAPEGSVGGAIQPLLEVAMGGLTLGGVGVLSAVPGLNLILDPSTKARLGREFAAGNVGDFYEQQRALLNRPATDANIEEFARRETAFFATQPGAAGIAGGLLSAEQRANLIKGGRRLDQIF